LLCGRFTPSFVKKRLFNPREHTKNGCFTPPGTYKKCIQKTAVLPQEPLKFDFSFGGSELCRSFDEIVEEEAEREKREKEERAAIGKEQQTKVCPRVLHKRCGSRCAWTRLAGVLRGHVGSAINPDVFADMQEELGTVWKSMHCLKSTVGAE